MTAATSQKLVAELKVSGHLMTLEHGLYCVFHAPGSTAADPRTGLPGVRVSHPPVQEPGLLSISTFNEDGWIGADASAALVRVNGDAAQLLVTIYQSALVQNEAPRLQVMRLGDAAVGAAQPPAARPAPARGPFGVEALAMPGGPLPRGFAEAAASSPTAAAPAADEIWEVAAHIQRRGDRLGRVGEWMGERGSQNWIEGFAVAPARQVSPADIEYQAVLGKGWLSPWSDGGQYCGSRGMALPILGLRVRLKGDAAGTHALRVSATFTDGTAVGPAPDTQTVEASSLAPLEAFLVEITPNEAAVAAPETLGKPDAAATVGAQEPAVATASGGKPTRQPAGKAAVEPAGKAPVEPAGRAGAASRPRRR
ncbi:hypothetical protein [Lichenicoccus sp.]|uniref:hypothetical protein n=1 Tax=Lichenicoccus sp. TaxID=2781899 RepID=UPI003D0BB055